MIRNLVSRLPSFKCTSDYAFSSSFRTRNFRSLSPVQRARTSVDSERSVSCSRVENGHIADVTHAPRARTLSFSKEYYAQKANDELQKKGEAKQDVEKKNEALQFETLEQYELEAAKPRPAKSRDVFEAFANAQPPPNGYFHLQPSSLKPYGSQDNMYSPSLIRPTNLLKYPRRTKKKLDPSENDSKSNTDLNTSGQRNYSTSSDIRQLSTSQSYVAKEGNNSKIEASKEQSTNVLYKNIDTLKSFIPVKKGGNANLNILKKISQNFQGSWTEPTPKLDFAPPTFRIQERNYYGEPKLSYNFSTPEMRRKRKERENRNRERYYKSSYSDLVKMRLREMDEDKKSVIEINNLDSEATSNKVCLSCITKNVPKPGHILKVSKVLPEQRSLTTRSKSNLLAQESLSVMTKPQVKNTLFSKNSAVGDSQDQRNYSKSKCYDKKGKKVKEWEEVDEEAGCDVCTPALKALHKSLKPQFPYEPQSCHVAKVKKKFYLPSKVKLAAIQTCAPPPEYKECIKIEKCPPRADECHVAPVKKLPKLPPGDCVCIDQYIPTKAPKLKELNLKFEDPPKQVCHEPPCQNSRADDDNPYKFKKLEPYVPGECECVQPYRLKNVKLKRLPKCTQEDVCRPPRVCPVPERCQIPRADECLRIKPKQLPKIKPSACPCIDPPVPKKSPPLKKLDLSVPEPPRVCPSIIACDERERADDSLKLTKKKLPKYVPGDCPCKDAPMIDWSPKRLVCEDEYNTDCQVPDPCKAFPRADWGCWEYADDVCNIVGEECVEKEEKCPQPPPPKPHPCDKIDKCEIAGGPRNIRDVPKRKYSISSASLKLYEQVKSQNISDDEGYIKTTGSGYKPPEIKPTKSKPLKTTTSQKIIKLSKNKKLKSASTLSLVKMLNQLEGARNNDDEPFLFKPTDDGKINYDKILKNIASSTGLTGVSVPQPRREPKPTAFSNTLKKSKSRSCDALKVTSRAISTSRSILKDEKDIRDKKELEGKKTCKNIKPTLKSMCKKIQKCPSRTPICHIQREHRPTCKKDTCPNCCEKEESPYPAFTDNLEETIKPFTKTSQWTCNRMQYGYYPNYKKEYEPLDPSKKKNKKSFSTCPSISRAKNNSAHFVEMSATKHQPNAWCTRLMGDTKPIPMSTKALLKMHPTQNIITTQNRTLSSKVFQIRPPAIGKPKAGKNCYDKFLDKGKSPKITCNREQEVIKPRWGCKRTHIEVTHKRRPPPFPAFSDCLDEEMEDILTECPLDKEKYLRMQPRFMNSPKRVFHIKPPPPIQGKLDLLKEQECIREKLCIENIGLTQSCSDFGKPVPLMKSRKLFKDVNPDCEKIEEMKRQGKWPLAHCKRQKRRICTSSLASAAENYRNHSTLGLNSISEFSKDKQMPIGLKSLYTRHYHALVKSTDKAILLDSEAKLKELTRKMFPDLDESTKILKLQKNIWKAQFLKNYEILNRHSNVAKRARRYYTTYKTKRKTFLRRQVKGYTLRTYLTRRKVGSNVKFLKYRSVNLRGSKFIKTGKPSNNARRDHSQDNAGKKGQPKFTLSNNSLRGQKRIGQRKTSEINGHKPPFPAFSERKKFSRSSDTKRYQPTYNFVIDNDRNHIQQFPEQDKVDRTLSFEYYKCKHGFKPDGTLDCQSLGFCSKSNDSGDCCFSNHKSPKQKKSIVELFVKGHKRQKHKSSVSCKKCKKQSCCCRKEEEDECAEDRRKLEEICMQHCMKCIPCHLPEEEKYCACREECKKIFQKKSEQCPEVNSECQSEPAECEPEPVQCREEEPICPPTPKNEICEPEPIVYVKPPPYSCAKQAKSDCSITSGSGQKIICPPAPCHPSPRRSKSITQLENIWQKIVNYFKARPNCPEPGEWKKRALKEKAEKAAKAAGLVVLNPKCLPPEILRTAKVSNDCKVCPKDPCDKSDCETNKSASPRLSRRKFSTVIQQSRSYSRSMSSQNLEEINRLLEETETKQRQLRYGSSTNFKKEFAVFGDRKDVDTSKAMKMSLEKELYKYVDLSELCCKEGPYSRTYFGYSDIIPSRENILERAWRISIESYNKYNCPKSYTFFNEFLNKIEKSIQSVEDLEKLKTENVLRELEEFLKNHDSDKNKK